MSAAPAPVHAAGFPTYPPGELWEFSGTTVQCYGMAPDPTLGRQPAIACQPKAGKWFGYLFQSDIGSNIGQLGWVEPSDTLATQIHSKRVVATDHVAFGQRVDLAGSDLACVYARYPRFDKGWPAVFCATTNGEWPKVGKLGLAINDREIGLIDYGPKGTISAVKVTAAE